MTGKLLSASESAQLLGLSVQQFRRAVARGELPEPLVKCRPLRWSSIQIDWALEGRIEMAQPLSPSREARRDRVNAVLNEIRR